MQNQESSIAYDKERAASFDKQVAKLAPMRDALHFLIRMVFSELPTDARILCVGAGTGSELIALAQAFPQWRFTALDPAPHMLNICRQRAEENGITSRCTFHEGYLDSLPETDSYDAATCILVSQFFMHAKERREFFSQIAARIRPEGYLVSADLASDMSTYAYNKIFSIWERTMKYSDMSSEEVEMRLAAFGRKIAVLPPEEVKSIIASSGFDTPVLFFQTLLIHAWFTKLAS
ncbi:MAG: class I SAM-dependent methyltransferase [Thiohalomonadales bacterium]